MNAVFAVGLHELHTMNITKLVPLQDSEEKTFDVKQVRNNGSSRSLETGSGEIIGQPLSERESKALYEHRVT